MKPFEKNERVTWVATDHGKEKKFVGLFQFTANGKAVVHVDGKSLTTPLYKLNRPRGRKPQGA
jgi:hypothetical protein